MAVKNIALSVGAKGISILVSLLIVPLTINYVNPTQYGIWIALSQLIALYNYFDFGLSNGFKNKYAEAKAVGNLDLARQYLSTTYFAISAIILLILLAALVINLFIDWSAILKVDITYSSELRTVFGIVSCFFCLNMVANIFSSLLYAEQKPGAASMISGFGQLLSLLVIFILTRTTTGSLTHLALYFSGVPCLTMAVASIFAFRHTKYKAVRPRIKDIRVKLIKNILGLGFQFFMIYLCMIAVFQLISIILSREIGPESVTEYNVAYKYFGVLSSVFTIIITPYWTAFTDAHVTGDVLWMKNALKRLELVWLGSCALCILMLAVSPLFFKLWLGDAVSVSFVLSITISLYIAVQNLANMYMYIINGLGTLRLQLLVFAFFAVLSWPLMTSCCRVLGTSGILVLPISAFVVLAIVMRIQIGKILNGTANGWWNK